MDSTLLRIDSGLKLQIPDADIPERQRKAGEVMFADMISMGDMSQTEDFQVDVMDEAVGSVSSDGVEAPREKPADAYEKYQYKDKTIRAESKEVSKQDVEKVETEVTEFTENVTEVIAEELHVSKEEIEAAMEELGLTFMDLLDAGNLASLVTKLSGGEDANQLLCSEAFTNILQQVNVLGKEMFANLQMTPEEVELIQQELAKLTAEDVVTLEQDEADNTINQQVQEDVVTVNPLETVSSEEVVGAVEDSVALKQTKEAKDEAIVPESDSEDGMEATKDVRADKVVVEVASTDDSKEEKFSEQMDNSEEELSNEIATSKETAGLKTVNAAETKVENPMFSMDASANAMNNQPIASEGVQNIPTYISVADIIEQFAEQTRVHITQDTTKMEMLLNPEHLGKLYLEITEQEGAVTAKIQTQNAIVKEALEAQIADLRQNLSQAGVKVDAIEVTIASHEFERNLEQDANSQRRQEDAQPRTARIRNINMNELDGLSGLMTEEEAIVAKMMAEQGNSVNFTA